MAKKNYRGICVGDIHLGIDNSVGLYNDLKEILVGSLTEDIDFVVIKGDYFDKKLALNSEVCKLSLRFMYELIEVCETKGIKLRVLRGTSSHDLNQLDNFKYMETIADCFRIINTVEYEELFPDLHVLYIPEEYPINQKEYYSEYFDLEEGSKYDFIFGHGTFEFAAFRNQITESERPVRSSPVFSEKEMLKIANYVFFGHIHTRMSYKDRLFYSGSFTRWIFGEEEPKGFHTIDYNMETCDARVQFVENVNAPKYPTVYIEDLMSEHDGDDAAVRRAIREMRKNCFKLRVMSETPEPMVVLREHFSENDGIVIKAKKAVIATQERSDELDYVFEEGDSVCDTVRRFITLRTGRSYTNDQITDCLTDTKGTEKNDD